MKKRIESINLQLICDMKKRIESINLQSSIAALPTVHCSPLMAAIVSAAALPASFCIKDMLTFVNLK